MNIVPFEPGHLHAVVRKAGISAEHVAPLTSKASRDGLSWSAMEGDGPIACAGLLRNDETPHLAEGWCIVGAMPFRDAYRIMLVIQQRLPELMDKHGIHRVQAHVLTDFPKACRWAARIGLEFNTVLRAATPDRRDMALYDMVRV